MQDLNREYDILQQQYGAPELHSIYNGGCEDKPETCFIFMNPTSRNIASLPSWKGQRAPWIGTKTIWKLFYRLQLLDDAIYQEILKRSPADWDAAFAKQVYNNVYQHRYFITNLGKCTQLDARPLSNAVYKIYLELLYKEIDLLKPAKIITFGNQVSSIFLNQAISVSACRKQSFQKCIHGVEYEVYPIYYPVGNGLRNMELAIADLTEILKGPSNL